MLKLLMLSFIILILISCQSAPPRTGFNPGFQFYKPTPFDEALACMTREKAIEMKQIMDSCEPKPQF